MKFWAVLQVHAFYLYLQSDLKFCILNIISFKGFLFPFVGVEGAFGALLPGVAVCTWLYVGRIRIGSRKVHSSN